MEIAQVLPQATPASSIGSLSGAGGEEIQQPDAGTAGPFELLFAQLVSNGTIGKIPVSSESQKTDKTLLNGMQVFTLLPQQPEADSKGLAGLLEKLQQLLSQQANGETVSSEDAKASTVDSLLNLVAEIRAALPQDPGNVKLVPVRQQVGKSLSGKDLEAFLAKVEQLVAMDGSLTEASASAIKNGAEQQSAGKLKELAKELTDLLQDEPAVSQDYPATEAAPQVVVQNQQPLIAVPVMQAKPEAQPVASAPKPEPQPQPVITPEQGQPLIGQANVPTKGDSTVVPEEKEKSEATPASEFAKLVQSTENADKPAENVEEPAKSGISDRKAEAASRHAALAQHTTRPEGSPAVETAVKGMERNGETIDLSQVEIVVQESPLQKESSADGSPQGHSGAGKDSHGQPAMQFEIGNMKTVGQPQAAQPAETPKVAEHIEHEHILSQVREKLESSDRSGNGQISLTLHPAELGELKINVRMEDMRLKVEIVAENKLVKDALLQNLDTLKESLAKQQINMDRFDVATGGGQGQNQQQAFREGRQAAQNPFYRPYIQHGDATEAGEVQKVAQWQPRENALIDVRY